jgi:hypothetical protein
MHGVLTHGLVAAAYSTVYKHIEASLSILTKRQHLAVVVTATEAINPRDPEESFEDSCYLVTSFGDEHNWEHDYKEIALSKADKSVRTGKGSAELPPHYLLDGDTVFWGSVVLDDIVVACSGVEPYYDEMFSMWIAAAIKVEAKRYMDKYPKDRDFIE